MKASREAAFALPKLVRDRLVDMGGMVVYQIRSGNQEFQLWHVGSSLMIAHTWIGHGGMIAWDLFTPYAGNGIEETLADVMVRTGVTCKPTKDNL